MMGLTALHRIEFRCLLIASVFIALVAKQPLAACSKTEEVADTWIEVEGVIYGCVPDSSGPIGGGAGYRRAVVLGDYVAVSVEQLVASLRLAKSGETVYIPGGVVLNFTTLVLTEDFVLRVPGGVTLASNRGIGASIGALLKSDALQTLPLINVDGPGVRLTGMRIQGPDPERNRQHWRESFSILHTETRGDLTPRQYYYSVPIARGVYTEFDNLEVDNCDLSGWSHAAVFLANGIGHNIHHNHIHHNQGQGLGYGISHGEAFSVVE